MIIGMLEENYRPIDVVDIWKKTEAARLPGSTRIARAIACEIANQRRIRVSEPYLSRILSHFPTEPYIYPETKTVIEGILERNNTISTWSEGDRLTQALKVATSGLMETRRRFGKDEFQHYCSDDKIRDLPDYLNLIPEDRPVIIVDDKSKNVKRIFHVIEDLGRTNVYAVWINQGRTKDEVPEGYTVEAFKKKFATIGSLRELLPADSTAPLTEVQYLIQNGKAHVLLDIDHTLLNTRFWMNAIAGDINAKLQAPWIVDPIVDGHLGLSVETHALRQVFANGMSGRLIAAVNLLAGGTPKVFKVGRNSEEKRRIEKEAAGYSELKKSPLSPFLVRCHTQDAGNGILVSDYFDGKNIRELLQTQQASASDVIPVLKSITDLVTHWWQRQERKLPADGYISMQRDEWLDTADKVRTSIERYAQEYDLSVSTIMFSPLSVNGITVPSLNDILNGIHDFMTENPPYTYRDHNDLTGANVLLDSQGNYRIIDFEWVGQGDPAESYVRMAKWLSSTTIVHTNGAKLYPEADLLIIEGFQADKHWSEDLIVINNFYEALILNLSKKIMDDDFERRVKHYYVGSYLRELALTEKRKNISAIPIILALIAQYYGK